MYNDYPPDSTRWNIKTSPRLLEKSVPHCSEAGKFQKFPTLRESCSRCACFYFILSNSASFFNSLLWSAKWILKIPLLLAACFYLSWTVDSTASIVFLFLRHVLPGLEYSPCFSSWLWLFQSSFVITCYQQSSVNTGVKLN